jgi:hypothetical protein
MGWEQINLSEIPLDEKPQPVPGGTYTLQVMGAEESKFRAGAINVTTSIVDEGPYMGRRVFLDIPNVEEQAWAAKIVAGLYHALGVTPTPYSNPIDELNRLATNGHSRFTAEVGVETFKRNDGTSGSKNKINTRSMRPAA